MFNSSPSLADIAAVTGGGGNRNGGGGFGDGGGWWAIIILLALFGGFGGRGWGGGGGGGSEGGGSQGGTTTFIGGGCGCSYATTDQVQRGFDQQNLNSQFATLYQAVGDIGYNQLAQINGINSTIMQTGFGLQRSIDGVSREIAECCCKTQGAIEQVRYDNAMQTCELGQRIDNVGRAIHEELTQMRIEDKNDRIAELTQQLTAANLAASQARQNQYLINELKPCPTPAYVVPNPNCCYTPQGYGFGGYGYGNGCGC